MKRIEKLAMVLIVAWIVQAVSGPAILTWIMKQAQGAETSPVLDVLGYVSGVCRWIVAIVCGVWLFAEADREKQSKWVWCLLGLLFHLQAVAIFVLYTILQEMRSKGRANHTSEVIVTERSEPSR
jgi:hypothetical protein